MTWRKTVKALMDQQDLTQEDLMTAFDVTTRGGVGHYLANRRQPTIEQLVRVAKRLGVTVSDLVGDARHDSAKKKPSAVHLHGDDTEGGILDAVARTKIGNRLFEQIKRTGRTPASVAARLKLSTSEFMERARSGDFSLDDMAEIVTFIGPPASLDYIVLSKMPTAEELGPVAPVMAEMRERAKAAKVK